MQPLRYGIVGGGFISGFQLRALRQVRGVEVAELVSRRPPEQLAAYVREHALGEGRVFRNIKEMAPHVDVVAIFAPNFARLEMVQEHGPQRKPEPAGLRDCGHRLVSAISISCRLLAQ